MKLLFEFENDLRYHIQSHHGCVFEGDLVALMDWHGQQHREFCAGGPEHTFDDLHVNSDWAKETYRKFTAGEQKPVTSDELYVP